MSVGHWFVAHGNGQGVRHNHSGFRRGRSEGPLTRRGFGTHPRRIIRRQERGRKLHPHYRQKRQGRLPLLQRRTGHTQAQHSTLHTYVRSRIIFIQERYLLPGELEEEPSTSHLKIHLDTGDLVVKAPKLTRGDLRSSSPALLALLGIRGTMFQIVVARDPDTGTVSGGVNLISGDIDFTDVSGDTSILASGQGLEVSTGKLGDSFGGVSGELRDLSAKFGPVLAGTGAFPPIVGRSSRYRDSPP